MGGQIVGHKLLFVLRNFGVTQLHAGLHKTGTTTLQRSLASAGLLQRARRADFREPDSFRRVLLEAASNKRVVSSEHLLGEMYDIYSTAVERFRHIQQVLERSQLTLYVRPHTQWHAAAYSQIVQQGTILSQRDYEAQIQDQRYFRWKQLASDLLGLSSPSAKVCIRVSGDVVADYARIIGVPLKSRAWSNQSLSPMALEALVRLRDEGFSPSSNARQALKNFMPESRLSCSVFSRSFQTRLKGMKMDWIQFSEEMASSGQSISPNWAQSYDDEIRPPASEIFTTRDLTAAKDHIRFAAGR